MKIYETTEEGAGDAELMRRSACGDEAAFRVLVERYAGLVRGTIFRMGWSVADTDDIAQQVFIRVWKAAPTYRPSAKFASWLLTITRNVMSNEVRKRKRTQWISMESPEATEGNTTWGSDGGKLAPHAVLKTLETQEAIETAIAELPEKQRLALILHRYEEQSHEVIAQALKTSVPSVKSLIFRAKETLREKLAHFLAS